MLTKQDIKLLLNQPHIKYVTTAKARKRRWKITAHGCLKLKERPLIMLQIMNNLYTYKMFKDYGNHMLHISFNKNFTKKFLNLVAGKYSELR